MKSEAETVESTPNKSYQLDIQPQAQAILQAMVDLGKPYGQNYIAQFVTADKYISFRLPHQGELPSYGKLRAMNASDVVSLIHHLIDVGYIVSKEPDFLTITVTESGLAWLGDPQPWTVARSRVRYSAFERYLRDALRQYRRDAAMRLDRKPWEVISDYVLDRIVQAKPLDLNALSRVPGFDTRKCEQVGAGFVKTVQEVIEHFEEYKRANLLVRVKQGKYPRIKKLFEDDHTIPEIATACGLTVGTVCGYLRELHDAAEVDLVPWIERNINARSLFRGVEYFERVSRPQLKEAHNILGLDYNTLLFCRLYLQDKRMRQQESALLQQDRAVKMAS